MTPDEQAFYSCGDLTPSDAAAGNTTPLRETSPGNSLLETPYAVILPLLALAGIGGAFVVRRRRFLETAP
jgi:MYXO-CTERM domain-containing protein